MSLRRGIVIAVCAAAGVGLGAGVSWACTPTNDDGIECVAAGNGRVVAIEDSVVRELVFSNICETDLIVTYEWAGDFISRKTVPARGTSIIRCNGAVCTGELTWGAVCDGQTSAGKVAAVSVTGPAVALEALESEEEQEAAAPAQPAPQPEPAAPARQEPPAAAPEPVEEATVPAEPEPAPPEPEADGAGAEAPWTAETAEAEAAEAIEEAAEATTEDATAPLPVVETVPEPAITPTQKPQIEARAAPAPEPTAEPSPAPAPVEEVKVAAVPKTPDLDIPTQKIVRSPVKDGAPPAGLTERELDELLIGRWRAAGKADLECEVQSTTGTISIKERQAPFFYAGEAVVETEVDVKDGCQLKIGWPTAWTYESDISLTVHGDNVNIVWHKVTERNPGGVSRYTLEDGKLVAVGGRSRAGGSFEEVLTRR